MKLPLPVKAELETLEVALVARVIVCSPVVLSPKLEIKDPVAIPDPERIRLVLPKLESLEKEMGGTKNPAFRLFMVAVVLPAERVQVPDTKVPELFKELKDQYPPLVANFVLSVR